MNNQPIPETQIIELREQNKKTIKGPNAGEYEVVMDSGECPKLREGDSVQLFSAFIDTETHSDGLINLEPDTPGGTETTISADVGYYISNVPNTKNGFYSGTTKINHYVFHAGNSEANTDGEPYVGCYKTVTTPATSQLFIGVNYRFISGILTSTPKQNPYLINGDLVQTFSAATDPTKNEVIGSLRMKNRYGSETPAYNFVIKKISPDGVLFISNILISEMKKAGFDPKDVFENLPNFPDRTQPNRAGFIPLDLTTPQNSMSQNADGTFDNSLGLLELADDADGVIYEPIIKRVEAVLPSGKYTGEEISHRIGLEFTAMNANGNIPAAQGVVCNNAFLQSATQMRIDANGKSVNQEIYFVKASDASNAFGVTANIIGVNNFPVGTSQFGLLFNSGETGKFSIEMLHIPLMDVSRDNTLGLPEVRSYQAGGKQFWVNKYSGCYLSNLSPPNLWFDQMKFNPKTLLVNGVQVENKTLFGENVSAPVFNADNNNELKDGVNITGSDIGLDSTIDKLYKKSADGSFIDHAFDSYGFNPVFPNYRASTTQDNIPIFSGGIIDSGQYGQANEGYYQVEINMGIPQQFKGKDQYNNKVQGLVGKYYQSGSFTQSSGELGFTYIHKGADLELSSFKVRILNPDNTLATDIQNNNSVFLKINRTK
jgi:hypothetical protein